MPSKFLTLPLVSNRCHAGESNLGPFGWQSTTLTTSLSRQVKVGWESNWPVTAAPENTLPHICGMATLYRAWLEGTTQDTGQHQADTSRNQRWGPPLWAISQILSSKVEGPKKHRATWTSSFLYFVFLHMGGEPRQRHGSTRSEPDTLQIDLKSFTNSWYSRSSECFIHTKWSQRNEHWQKTSDKMGNVHKFQNIL